MMPEMHPLVEKCKSIPRCERTCCSWSWTAVPSIHLKKVDREWDVVRLQNVLDLVMSQPVFCVRRMHVDYHKEC